MHPILVITGPTASGKSGLAVELALRFNGEIISADSRQIYKGLDIGTGKITAEEMCGVPHHLLDVADPAIRYTVTDFREAAERAITDIISREKLPIICGGTGFYIDAVVNGMTYPATPRDPNFETSRKETPTETLVEELAELDPDRAESIDPQNRRRVLRALEIALALGKVPQATSNPHPDWKFLIIGVTAPDDVLKEKIKARLVSRIKAGMIDEVKSLMAKGLSYERCLELGLEYRYVAEYLAQKENNNSNTGAEKFMTETDLISLLSTKIWQYARRQKAWFKRNDKIQWFGVEEKEKIGEKVKLFLEN